ncbi:hypothetical protein IFG57_004011 [Salmonella enterica]|nr:hypothetical protein [Salmonella enterica]
MKPIEQSPNYLVQLQIKSGLTKAELANRLSMSLKSWDNLISKNASQKLPNVKFEFLLLLAGEHPDLTLSKRANAEH